MKVFCTDRVKRECEKLEKKNSYADLRKLLFEFITKKKSVKDWMEGSLIQRNPNFLFIKKRIDGSGGYRIYYLITIHNNEITLAALYPKFGNKGSIDLTDVGKVLCMKEALDEIDQKCRWQIKTLTEKKSIEFKIQEKLKVKKP